MMSKTKIKSITDVLKMESEQNFDLISFDVFDTLVTRTTYVPNGIFLLMQNQLIKNREYDDISDFVKYNFKTLRQGTEHFIRRTRSAISLYRRLSPVEVQQEFSLEEFYSFMGIQHDLTSEQQERLINLEIQTEINNSLPIKENIEVLKKLIQNNKRVVLISDMYLKEDVIRKILLQHDDIFKDIPIYVSSEYGQLKNSGMLYHIVAEHENIKDFSKWLHVGDSPYADIRQAEKIGIKTFQYVKEFKTEFEEVFYKGILLDTSPESQVMLGASIYTRNTLKDNPLADFATIATTVLYPYVKWVIQKSLNMGLTRLYFIARDGYVLKEIADVIIEQESITNLKTYYVYGSRQAWRFACSSTFEDVLIPFNCYVEKATIQSLANNFNLETDELLKFLPERYKKADKMLSTTELAYVKNILENNSEFESFIMKYSKEKRSVLVKYFKNFDFSDDKFAFVDLTGSGITNNLLSKLIKEEFGFKTKCFNIALTRNIANENLYRYSYIQSLFVPAMIEMFARAPHGQTIGYKEENGKTVPILEDSEVIDNFNDYIEAMVLNTKILNKAKNINDLKCLESICLHFQTSICRFTTKDIAKYFSLIPFSDVSTMKQYSFNKEKLNIIDVFKIYFLKSLRPDEVKLDLVVKNSNNFIKKLVFLFNKNKKMNLPWIKEAIICTIITIKSKL